MIVGEPKSGKTSLIERYVNDDFTELSHFPSDFAQRLIYVDEMTFAINLWDIGKIQSMDKYKDSDL